MKIEFIHADRPNYDGSGAIVLIDGKQFMRFKDGDPEDNSLGRNFNDVYLIHDLLSNVVKATEAGEKVEVSHREVFWDEFMEL